MLLRSLFVLILLFIHLSTQAINDKTEEQTMRDQEHVTFYPSYGYLDDDQWRIPIRVWVHEHEGWFSRQLSKLSKRVVRHKAGLEQLNDDQKAMFRLRFQDFVADSESFEAVHIRFDADPENETMRLQSADGDKRT